LRRLSWRLRLTIAFAVVMAIVLSATGWVVFGLFRADLNHDIDRSLLARSDEVAALVAQNNDSVSQSLQGVAGTEDDFAQVLRPAGALLASTPQVRGRSLMTAAALRRAARREVVFEHTPIPGLRGALRIRARPLDTAGARVVLAVGTSLAEREDSLRTLEGLLVGGGLVALTLASLAGYGVASAALRPVDAMRRRAAAISPEQSDRRLPIPPSGDEIARLGVTLNEMLDRLQAAFAHERAFTANASHELRTPLAILKAEIELALRHERSAKELRGALESVAEETDRLVRLAEELLVIARLDQGPPAIQVQEIDVGELLRKTTERSRARAAREERSLHAYTQGDIRMWGKEVRVERALDNLLENALRYSTCEVTLSALARGSVVELHVRDDGPGFEPGMIERAFQRFVRGSAPPAGRSARTAGKTASGSSPAEASEGAGLGLAIVAAIAAFHGGHVRAANLADGGADVWLELPVGEPPTAPQRALTESSPISVPAAPPDL
jgi:signal transduction histidine kinase